MLGYSWPPHLYQGLFKVEEKPVSVNGGMRNQEKMAKVSQEKALREFLLPEYPPLRSNLELVAECKLHHPWLG
jgi:hypothetical protein